MTHTPKTVCPKCQKGFHWAKESRSKFHKDGHPIGVNPSAPPEEPSMIPIGSSRPISKNES